MRSLRARLVIGTITATVAVLAVSGTALYVTIRNAVVGEFDVAITAKARALAAMVELKPPREFVIEIEDWQLPEFYRAELPEYFQIYWEGSGPVLRSRSLGERNLQIVRTSTLLPRIESIVLPDGRPGRVAVIPFEPRLEDFTDGTKPEGTAVLALARETANHQHVLTRIRWLLALVCGGAIVAASGLMLWIVRRALRPIDALALRIAGVGNANLSERIDELGVPNELLPLVARLNELLARVDAALARERAFSADVAHELRTPLSGLETALEVAASQQREPAEYQRVVARCLEVTRSLHSMIDNLLTLARAEAGQLQMSREAVSIDQVAQESWAPLERRATDKTFQVSWNLPQPCQVFSDRAMVGLVVRNLLDNAVSYCDTGGTIRVQASSNGQGLKLHVANTGSNLRQDQADRVFERFWRGDESRGGGGHCGLGLTLCGNIVRALGGTIVVTTSRGREFAVTVHLPG